MFSPKRLIPQKQKVAKNSNVISVYISWINALDITHLIVTS